MASKKKKEKKRAVHFHKLSLDPCSVCSRLFCASVFMVSGAMVCLLMISTLYANEEERDDLGKQRDMGLVVGIGRLFEQHSSGKRTCWCPTSQHH